MKTPKLDQVVNDLENHTEILREFIDQYLKHDGDTEATSQRMCLLNRLSALEHAINGITVEDLKP